MDKVLIGIKTVLSSNEAWNSLVLRLVLGITMFPHGAQKLMGWFGGHGFNGTMGFFTQTMGLPALIAFLVIVIEFFGSLGLIFGFLTRINAAGVLCIMVGAIIMVHEPNGFFMNWSGNQAGEGFEYHLLNMAICLALILGGAGRHSLDNYIAKKYL